MRRISTIALGVVVAAVWSIAVLGQTPAAQDSDKLPVTRRMLTLDVVVTDASGKPVRGLEAKDFTVLDSGRPAKIMAFRPPAPPVAGAEVDASTELIVILDEVNAPDDRAVYARLGIESYLKQNHGQLRHPVRLGLFTEAGLKLQTQPSVDGAAMAAALGKTGNAFRMMDRGTGFYGAEQRLKLSQTAMDALIAQEHGQPGRKMVIWVSGGWPLLAGPGVELDDRQRQHIYQSVVNLENGLRDDRIVMYSVDSLGTAGNDWAGAGSGFEVENRTNYYQNFVKPIEKASQAEFGDLGLPVLVTQSGGHPIFGDAMIPASINRCEAELDGMYTIVVPEDMSNTESHFHSVKVTLDQPGLKVRTRDGYYPQP
jgi:VWFA-related protein